MTTPTSQELEYLNTHPQQTDLYLSIFEPQVAMICQVTGSYSVANQSINFYNITTGSASNVDDYYFQVALIGTSPNSDDIGRTWVRSISGNTIRFLVSEHIDWASADYVTILKYTEIIPVFPRIIQNPADEEDVIFYKIWDIAYTDQNSILGTFINMGSNYAGFIESNGTGTCYWSASGTSNLLDDALTYSWIFEGATITGSSAHTPGEVAYTNTGDFRAILRVTSNSGRVDTSIRYVSFYDRPGAGDDVPILNWEILDWGGSRDGIGYSCRIKIRENIPKSKIIDGALIVIFGEDWYGTTKHSVSNNAKGRETIKFVGYIDAGTIQYNYIDGYIEFDVVSSTKFMEFCECFSCSIESKTSPAYWYELLNMDIRRATYNYLAWQSSVLLCCDLEFKNFVDQYIQYFDADNTSLYDAINSVVSDARGGKVVSDSLSKIWIEQEPDMVDDAANTFPVTLSISKKDWIGDLIIDERQKQDVSFMEIGGASHDPATNTFSALLSDAPGVAPAYRGKVERIQGLALADQDELNTIAGNKYAYMNSRYPNIELNLRGNYNNLDIAPQEIISMNIASSDTPRNIVFSEKEFVIRSKNISWNSQTKTILNRIAIAELTQGFAGTTVVIPDVPPGDGDDDGGGTYKIPTITVPPIPIPTTPGIIVLDEHILQGTASIFDFLGDNVVASITGSVAYINITGTTSLSIYHNDVFIGFANGLNFLDDA